MTLMTGQQTKPLSGYQKLKRENTELKARVKELEERLMEVEGPDNPFQDITDTEDSADVEGLEERWIDDTFSSVPYGG